ETQLEDDVLTGPRLEVFRGRCGAADVIGRDQDDGETDGGIRFELFDDRPTAVWLFSEDDCAKTEALEQTSDGLLRVVMALHDEHCPQIGVRRELTVRTRSEEPDELQTIVEIPSEQLEMPPLDVPAPVKITSAARLRSFSNRQVGEHRRELAAQLIAHSRVALEKLDEHAVIEVPRSWVLQRLVDALTQGTEPSGNLRGIHDD